MNIFRIKPTASLQGQLKIPPSKSHTLRALIFALLAEGTSVIFDPLDSPDVQAMLRAIRMLGAQVEVWPDRIEVLGTSGQLKQPSDIIDAGNSGIVLRFIGALGALIPHYMIITGDHSIRYSRLLQPLIDGLNQWGAWGASMKGDGFAPLLVKGPAHKNFAKISGTDSQPVSALLIAAAFLPYDSVLEVVNPGEKPWIDLTLAYLASFGIYVRCDNYLRYEIPGCSKIQGFTRKIPADFSSAAYPIAAAVITGSELVIDNLDMQDLQGDKKFIEILQRMGACIAVDSTRLIVKKSKALQGIHIDMNDCVDMVTIAAVVATFADSTTIIEGVKVARSKESDRIAAITTELQKMGAAIEETADGLIVHPSQLRGSRLQGHHDHRIALALSVAALGASSESVIEGVDVINKTYKDFQKDMQQWGALIE